jgi:hypothetical protein
MNDIIDKNPELKGKMMLMNNNKNTLSKQNSIEKSIF